VHLQSWRVDRCQSPQTCTEKTELIWTWCQSSPARSLSSGTRTRSRLHSGQWPCSFTGSNDLIRSQSWPTCHQCRLLLVTAAPTRPALTGHELGHNTCPRIRIVACRLLQHFVGRWAESGNWQVATSNECCCSCAIQHSQVRPRFVAAPALRASLARCAGKSSVQTRRRNVQLLARPIAAVPRRSLCTTVWRLSTAASSIRYSASLDGSAISAQPIRSTGLFCDRPIALGLSTRQLGRVNFIPLMKTHLVTLY